MTKRTISYNSLNHLVLRFPRYPVDTYIKCLYHESELMRILRSDDFKNAILFASPALYDELKRVLSGENTNPSYQKKVRLSLIKYLARMSSRCTPFASLASCGCLAWGDMTHIVSDEAKTESFRLDMLYCCMLVQKLLRDHDWRQCMSYCANSTIYRVGNHIRYITHVTRGQGRTYQVKELKLSSTLKWMLNHTKVFVSFSKIVDLFVSYFDVTFDDARQFVHTLIDNQLLVSEMEPWVTGQDIMVQLANKSEAVGVEWHQRVKTILDRLKCFSLIKTPKENEILLHQILELLDDVGITANPKYLVQLDSFTRHEHDTVDKRVVRQIMQGMDFLCRVMPMSLNVNLEQFKQRFTGRYQDQEIPLLEALDPDVGVGYVLTQDHVANPLIDGLQLPNRKQQSLSMVTHLQHLMMQKLSEHNWSKSNTITLADDDVKQFTPSYNDLPVSMAALFEILGKTASGDYLLGDLRFTGNSAANLLGRFAYGERRIKELVEQVTRVEQSAHDDAIIAEIAHIPQSRTGNILSRPHLRDYEIVYLSNSTMESYKQIPANDLLISVKQNRVVLRSRRLRKEILPRLTTAHNYSGTDPTPVYRFLCDLQHQNGRSTLMFYWGVLSTIDHLPRVMYRNIILSRERWTIKRKQLPFNKKTISEDNLRKWTLHYQLPKYVSLVAGDNKLLVDTHNVLSVEMMMSEMGQGESFVLEEFIPCKGISLNSQGLDCQNECVVPLIRTSRGK